ncbi:573_t:CDS:2, partial [Acaulospora colombiana]
AERYQRIEVSFALSNETFGRAPTSQITTRIHAPEEEIASRTQGYFVPLSGGIDSCATAAIVYSMCRLVAEAANRGDKDVIADARRIIGEPEESDYTPTDAKEFCGRIFHTCYMGTQNSSADTRRRAKELAASIGSYHVDLNMDTVVTAVHALFATITGRQPRFRVHGGTNAENLALQNIQARLRMVLAYLFAQLLPWVRGRVGGLLVLAAYGDILRSMIAHLTDLKKFIAYAQTAFDLPVLESFLTAVPTAELEPITENYVQADEADMGMTYNELSIFGRLRKVEKCGPYSMFTKLVNEWSAILSPTQVRAVRLFSQQSHNHFVDCLEIYFEVSRVILTRFIIQESYSPDDNRE